MNVVADVRCVKAAVFVYIALDNELDPPAKELKQKQKEK